MFTNVKVQIFPIRLIFATILLAALFSSGNESIAQVSTGRIVVSRGHVQEPEKDEPEQEESESDVESEQGSSRRISEFSRRSLEGSELNKPIMDIRLDILETSDRAPRDQSSQLQELNYAINYPGTFQDRLAMWAAANIRYQPLYFEDVGHERYGYAFPERFQPAVSALHFAGSFALLVPNMLRQRPRSFTYPLGYCRPGSIAPQIGNRWTFFR